VVGQAVKLDTCGGKRLRPMIMNSAPETAHTKDSATRKPTTHLCQGMAKVHDATIHFKLTAAAAVAVRGLDD
jgi:hypothetical protein